MPQKPVVFIPGFPASELHQKSKQRRIFPPDIGDLLDPDKKRKLVDLLAGPDNPPGDIEAGEPIRDVLGIAKQAESLYDILRSNYGYTIRSGDNFRPVGWDWRKAVDDSAVQQAALAAIAELRQANGNAKVVVIAHSTGSLVLRRLLETQPDAVEGIEQILSFGATWAGNVVAIRSLVRGNSIGLWPARLSSADVRKVVRRAQAAYDLFPPDPAKTDLKDRAGKPLKLFVDDSSAHRQLGPLVDLRWAPSGDRELVERNAADSDQRLGRRTIEIQSAGGRPTPPITNVVGWGVETNTSCVMDAQGDLEFEISKEGDGTSAAVSASWLGGQRARTFFLPIGVYPTNGIPMVHARIWDSPPVLQLFDQVLLDHTPEPFVCAAADSSEMIDRRSDVTLRITAEDGEGNPLPNARVLLRGVSTTSLSFAGRRRMDAIVPRAAIRPSQGVFRFITEVSWDAQGEREARELVVLLKS